MYKIGEFSILSKTTIKTLRYYEKEKLLLPSFIDNYTGYRFYETKQLLDIARIISLRQIGISIDNIRNVLNGADFNEMLNIRKQEIEKDISTYNEQLSRINYLLEGKNMSYEVVIKEIPAYIVYYKQERLKDFSAITQFILSSAQECKKDNPNLKCIEPDYCYMTYLDGEYRDKDLLVRYSQAVTQMGVSNETIKFEKTNEVTAACIYHKGAYQNLGDAYSFIIKWIDENGYVIAEPIRERYIDGMWNKENTQDWLTEIQVPITRK